MLEADIRELFSELEEIIISKNRDYDNSFGETFRVFGLESAVIRLIDKINRLKNLIGKEPEVVNEKIEDTLMDLINYSVLTLLEIRKQK